MKFTGLIAWLAWLVVHIYYLIGFKNRVLVLLQWAWSYLTSKRGARLITGFPAEEEAGAAQAGSADALREGNRPRVVE